MNGLPTLERLIALLTRFPGVGRKSAQRMAYFLLRRGKEDITQLATTLLQLRDQVHPCPRCFNLAEGELCWICTDPNREPTLLCVVEEPGDLLAIERAGLFRGRYHVLGGQLNPMDYMGPEQLRIAELEQRLDQEPVQEIILATNPTVEGEATAHYIVQRIKHRVTRITRLAYGLPMGGEMEYVDESTLYQALAGRRDF